MKSQLIILISQAKIIASACPTYHSQAAPTIPIQTTSNSISFASSTHLSENKNKKLMKFPSDPLIHYSLIIYCIFTVCAISSAHQESNEKFPDTHWVNKNSFSNFLPIRSNDVTSRTKTKIYKQNMCFCSRERESGSLSWSTHVC